MSEAFPFTGSSASSSPLLNLPTFREYAWDFDKDRFLRDGAGNMILLEKNEALKVWIYHAMKVERWAYLAYSSSYGVETQQFFGKVMTVGERRSELRRTIIEALMVSPYIRSVDKVEFEDDEHGRLLKANVELTTIYGKMNV